MRKKCDRKNLAVQHLSIFFAIFDVESTRTSLWSTRWFRTRFQTLLKPMRGREAERAQSIINGVVVIGGWSAKTENRF
jgi:hypothetical protein